MSFPKNSFFNPLNEETMMRNILKVEGMTCQHCVQTVSDAVGKVSGVQKVAVDLEQKEVTVDFDESQTKTDEISAQITAAGFEVV
jgi:copper chaperone